jgi:hypothetical protein
VPAFAAVRRSLEPGRAEKGNVSYRCGSRRLKAESQLLSCSANALIKAKEFHARNAAGAANADARWMAASVRTGSPGNGRLPRSTISALRRSKCQCAAAAFQMGASIGGSGFIDLTKNHGADQYPVAFEQCEIGGDHDVGPAEDSGPAEPPIDCARWLASTTPLVVGHEMFNRFIATQLSKRGWQGPRLLPGGYWGGRDTRRRCSRLATFPSSPVSAAYRLTYCAGPAP